MQEIRIQVREGIGMITEVYESKCTGCGKCFTLCPLDVLRLNIQIEDAPPCQAACPAGVDMRGYMYLLKLDRIDEAIKLIRKSLPIPAITGRVCFHPCETECARKEVDEAVNINALERFVADYWLEEKAEPAPRLHVSRVAVVGSGPAGLTAAYDLIKMGYPVTVYESMKEPGGMLRIGIPEYRLPRDILNAQIKYIKDLGVEFITKTVFGKDFTIDGLKDRGYKAVFLAIGAQLSRKLNIEGSELDGVLYGLKFLADVNLHRNARAKGKVVVIGGGDVAVDAARSALRLGAEEVTIVYRRSREEMPSHKENLRQALDEGIKLDIRWAPKRILGKNGKVTGVEFVRSASAAAKKAGAGLRYDEKVAKSIDADMVVFAVGQTCDQSLLPPGVSNKDGIIVADPVTLETTAPGVFAGGDAVRGPASVVEAIASGRRAAVSIDRYLRGQDMKADREKKVNMVGRPPLEGIEGKARHVMPFIPVEQRNEDFSEVKNGLAEEIAMLEAERCMTCGSKAYIAYPEDCMTCYTCELKCPYEAISVHPFKEVLPRAIEYPAR